LKTYLLIGKVAAERAILDTKDKILDVAQELIQQRGLNAMSFKDLSDAVGISKPSVHHHFATKSDMVCALLTRYQNEFQNIVCKILESKTSAKTKLKRYYGLFLQTIETGDQDKSCLCGMLVAELYSLESEEADLVRSFFRSNIGAIQTILDQGVEDGSLKPGGSPEVILAALEGGLLIARCDGGSERFSKIVAKLLTTQST